MTHEDAHDAAHQPQHDDVEGHVVEGQGEAPDGQDGADVTESDGEDAPQELALGQGAQQQRGGQYAAQPDPHQGQTDADSGDQQDVSPPAVDHVARQGAGAGQHQDGHRPGRQLGQGAGDDGAKSPGDQQQIKIDEG